MSEAAIRQAADSAEVLTEEDVLGPVDILSRDHAVVAVGDKALVLREITGADGRPAYNFLTIGAFKQLLSNRRIAHGKRDASIADLWLESPYRRTYLDGMTFSPEGAPAGFYNLWRGFDVAPADGDCSIFLDHMRTNICQGSDTLFQWVMGWFAQMVQQPSEKLGTALVLRGKQGTGKTIVGKVIGSLFSRHYYLVDDPRYLLGHFNSHMADCLLLQADEGFWAGDKQAEGRLKSLVTSDVQLIEKKGVDAFKVRNLLRLLITSNNGWVVPAGMDERRFAVLDVGENSKQNHGYFAEMHAQLDNGGREALLQYLLAFDLSSVNLRQIPRTDALDDQVINSLTPVHAWWFGCLRAGTVLADHEGWHEEILSKDLFDGYIRHSEKVGIKRRSEEVAVARQLREVVLSLPRVRVTAANGARPYAYRLPSLEECRETFEKVYGWQGGWD